MPMVVYCCSYSFCAFSLLVLNIVVASCWSSSGDVESGVLKLLHARTHLTQKKKIAPVIRMVVVTRRMLHLYSRNINFKADRVLRRHSFLGTKLFNSLVLTKNTMCPSRRTTCSKGVTRMLSCFIYETCPLRPSTCSKGATRLLTNFCRGQTPGVKTMSGDLLGD
jgi:hypothetical protein